MPLTEVPAKRTSAGAGILNIMKFAQQLLIICLAGAAIGCGQKGPLVMPDAQKHKRTLPTVPGAAKPANGSSTSPAPTNGGAATGSAAPAPPPSSTPSTPPPASTPPTSGTPPSADS